MKKRNYFHNVKVVASFALLGAVVVGALFGAMVDVDLRPYGAALGGVGAIIFKLYQVH